MSDSPNRAVDFGAGVLVGILLAVGIGGAYLFTQLREQRLRSMELEIRANLEAERARTHAVEAAAALESYDKTRRELDRLRSEGPAEVVKPAEAPAMPPVKDPE